MAVLDFNSGCGRCLAILQIRLKSIFSQNAGQISDVGPICKMSLKFTAFQPVSKTFIQCCYCAVFRLADDLVVIAETEDDLIKRLSEWKDNVENRAMRVNMN